MLDSQGRNITCLNDTTAGEYGVLCLIWVEEGVHDVKVGRKQ